MHFTNPPTLATFAVAGVTFALVAVTYRQVLASRHAFNLSMRPMLAEVPFRVGAPKEAVQFGAPGRSNVVLADHEFYLSPPGDIFQFSVSFRNVGGGVAVITGVDIAPEAPGECVFSRKFVRPGEHVRVNKSVQLGLPESQALVGSWRTTLAVNVEYCDADGGQPLVSTAQIREYATHAAFVQWIEVFEITRTIFGTAKRKLLVTSGHSAG